MCVCARAAGHLHVDQPHVPSAIAVWPWLICGVDSPRGCISWLGFTTLRTGVPFQIRSRERANTTP